MPDTTQPEPTEQIQSAGYLQTVLEHVIGFYLVVLLVLSTFAQSHPKIIFHCCRRH